MEGKEVNGSFRMSVREGSVGRLHVVSCYSSTRAASRK